MDVSHNGTISLSGEDEAELRGYRNRLRDGGTVGVPLEKAPWGDAFGMCTDRFGVDWMVNIVAPKPWSQVFVTKVRLAPGAGGLSRRCSSSGLDRRPLTGDLDDQAVGTCRSASRRRPSSVRNRSGPAVASSGGCWV